MLSQLNRLFKSQKSVAQVRAIQNQFSVEFDSGAKSCFVLPAPNALEIQDAEDFLLEQGFSARQVARARIVKEVGITFSD